MANVGVGFVFLKKRKLYQSLHQELYQYEGRCQTRIDGELREWKRAIGRKQPLQAEPQNQYAHENEYPTRALVVARTSEDGVAFFGGEEAA